MNDWQNIEKQLLIDIIKMDEPRQQALNTLKEKVCNYITEMNGGKGSGNWGHSGRPGLVGGSAPGGGRSSKSRKPRSSSESKSSEPSVIEPTKFEVGELPEPDTSNKSGKFTEDEKNAINEYVSGEMMWINQYLRGRMPEDTVIQPHEQKVIDNLKSATNRPLDEDMTLYRAVDAQALFGEMTDSQFWMIQDYLQGADMTDDGLDTAITILERGRDVDIVEKGFMSTTKDKDTATGWGDFTGSDKPVVLELKVPKGTKGIDLGEVMPELDKSMGQSEVLLHPGVTYRITGFRVDDGFIFTADVKGQQNNRLEVAKANFIRVLNGGKGSGNFGHDGRPGLVGGSSPRGGGSSKAKSSSQTHRGLSAEVQERLGEAKKSISNSEQDLVGKRQRAIGVLQSLDLYAEPGRYDVDGEQWVVENPLELNDSGDDEILQYAFNKDGDKKTVVELGLTDRASRDEHYTESYAEHPKYDLDEFRKKNKTDSSIPDEALNKIRDFTDDSYARSEALRKGNVSEDDRIIDSVFEASENGSETVYRGLQGDYAKQIANLNVGDTFTDPSYVYTTRDLNIANYFSKDVSGERGTVLVINLPDGKGISLNLDNIGTAYSAQQQTLLNRDLQFTVTGKKGNVVIVEASKQDNENRNSISVSLSKELRQHRLVESIKNFTAVVNGGKGSGYHNHPGRKGKVGGSAPRSASQPVYDDYTETNVKYYDGRQDTTIRSSKKREADIRRIKSMADNYDYENELSQASDEVIRHMADEELPRITHSKLLEVQFNRMLAYRSAGRTKEDFDQATEVLKDAMGSGGDLLYKAKQRGVDLSIEREMSKRLMGDNKILVFRQQDGKFKKNDPNNITSRWSDIPNTNDGSGDNYYSAEANKDNIFIHPLVLYSAAPDDNATKSYSGEREYILENSKIKKIKKGTRVV